MTYSEKLKLLAAQHFGSLLQLEKTIVKVSTLVFGQNPNTLDPQMKALRVNLLNFKSKVTWMRNEIVKDLDTLVLENPEKSSQSLSSLGQVLNHAAGKVSSDLISVLTQFDKEHKELVAERFGDRITLAV